MTDSRTSKEKVQRLAELVEYMEACALIARNGAEIHSQSKELRHHAHMVTAAVACLTELLEYASESPDKFEADIWPMDYQTARLSTDAMKFELDYGAFGGELDEYSPAGRVADEPSDAPEYVADDAHDAKKCAPIERIYRDAYNEFAGPPQYRHAVNFDTYNRAGLIALWNAARRSPPPPANHRNFARADADEIERLQRVTEDLERGCIALALKGGLASATGAGVELSADLYALLVKRGYAQHEAHAIAYGDKLAVLSEPPPARLLRPLLATFQQSHGVNPQELWVLNRFVNWVDEPLLAPTKDATKGEEA